MIQEKAKQVAIEVRKAPALSRTTSQEPKPDAWVIHYLARFANGIVWTLMMNIAARRRRARVANVGTTVTTRLKNHSQPQTNNGFQKPRYAQRWAPAMTISSKTLSCVQRLLHTWRSLTWRCGSVAFVYDVVVSILQNEVTAVLSAGADTGNKRKLMDDIQHKIMYGTIPYYSLSLHNCTTRKTSFVNVTVLLHAWLCCSGELGLLRLYERGLSAFDKADHLTTIAKHLIKTVGADIASQMVVLQAMANNVDIEHDGKLNVDQRNKVCLCCAEYWLLLTHSMILYIYKFILDVL
jgi:hypothetical protein